MKFKYNTMSFGKKENRINVIHLKKPLDNGFAGMITSGLFRENIAVVVMKNEIDFPDCQFACLSSAADNTSVKVEMEENIFYGIKRNDKMARTVLFHELGHYYYNHLKNGTADMEVYASERLDRALHSEVIPQELEADLFAARYLGHDYVMTGLNMLIRQISKDEAAEIAIAELRYRIEHIALDAASECSKDDRFSRN